MSCFFSPSLAFLSVVLRDKYLTSAARIKERDKAGSNQPPARDPVQFKLELTPNYLMCYLENTGSRSTRYVSMPHPNESSILPKFLEKSDPEVARPAFSTWPVQKSQPKAFEVCASIQIHQSAYRDRWQFKTITLPRTGMFVWSLYADWWIWIDAFTVVKSLDSRRPRLSYIPENKLASRDCKFALWLGNCLFWFADQNISKSGKALELSLLFVWQT